MRVGNLQHRDHQVSLLDFDMQKYIFIFVVLSLLVATVRCSQPNANYEILESRNLQCPAGANLEYLPWGESGMSATCVVKHGPVVIAEGGRVVIEGAFIQGKEIGEWRWFDKSGKIFRSEHRGTAENR